MDELYDATEREQSNADSREAVIALFRQNFGDVIDAKDKDAVAEEILEWCADNGFCRNGTTTHDNNEIVKYFKLFLRLFWKGAHGKWLFACYFAMSEAAPWIKDIYGGYSIAAFARWLCDKKNPQRRYLRLTKQALNKDVQRVLIEMQQMGITIPLPKDLRTVESREKMRQAAIRNHAKTEHSKFADHESV
jgi:hypothetical protein